MSFVLPHIQRLSTGADAVSVQQLPEIQSWVQTQKDDHRSLRKGFRSVFLNHSQKLLLIFFQRFDNQMFD